MEWSFRYSGPNAPRDDRDCALCNTVARKKCLQHGAPIAGCSHCDAIAAGCCPSHCGIARALEEHDKILAHTDAANFKWKRVEAPADVKMQGQAMQERAPRPDSVEKSERVAAAKKHFDAVKALVLIDCESLPPDAMISVDARGDRDLPLNNPANLVLHIQQLW